MNKPEKNLFIEYKEESERLVKEKYERFLQECGVEVVINLIYRNLKFIPLQIVEFKEGGYHVMRYLGFRVPTKVLDDNDKKYDLVYYFDDTKNKFFKFCGPDPDNNFIPIVEEIEIFEEGMQNAIVAILNDRIKENHNFFNTILMPEGFFVFEYSCLEEPSQKWTRKIEVIKTDSFLKAKDILLSNLKINCPDDLGRFKNVKIYDFFEDVGFGRAKSIFPLDEKNDLYY